MSDRVVLLTITCAIALAAAVGLVLTRRLVRCACLLLIHSLAIAAIYLVLSADFLAMGQVVVHSGAIVVLFLFVVLLLPHGGKEVRPTARRTALALGGGIMMLAGLAAAVADLPALGPEAPATADLSTASIAHALFGPQLVAFELTSLLLLIAILGAVCLWQREAPEGGT